MRVPGAFRLATRDQFPHLHHFAFVAKLLKLRGASTKDIARNGGVFCYKAKCPAELSSEKAAWDNLHMHYCYILKSKKDGSYYIGSTQDLKKRLEKHNHKEVTYSSSKAPFELVWYGAFKTKELALSFEKYLKSSSGFAFRNRHLVSPPT
jgi:putative endonuclease